MSRLKGKYQTEIVPTFLTEGIKNKMAVPKVKKVVINVGIGKNRSLPKYKEEVTENLMKITGQKPTSRRARKAISEFKIKMGDEVGLMVTLRGEKMYDFLDKLANITLPRLRDFRGLNPKSIDNFGNFSLGMKEHLIFPEISGESGVMHGLGISVNTTAQSKEETQKLLEYLGFPFIKKENNG